MEINNKLDIYQAYHRLSIIFNRNKQDKYTLINGGNGILCYKYRNTAMFTYSIGIPKKMWLNHTLQYTVSEC